MKVFEKINELKGTNASKEQIANWSQMNKICPLIFEQGLELDGQYPDRLYQTSRKCCEKFVGNCGAECLDAFLESEFLEN